MVGESLSRVSPAVGLRPRETSRAEGSLSVREPHPLFYISKRLVDVAVAGVLLVVTLPLMLVAGAAVFLTTDRRRSWRRGGLGGWGASSRCTNCAP